MRIAYLCSRYPAVSHTFVLREVHALRRRGIDVHTFSVRRARSDDLLSELDRSEAENTFAVLPPKPLRLLVAHLIAFFKRPLRYFSTLWTALRLSPGGLRGLLWQLFYFLEAMVVWRECSRRGIRHLHVHFVNGATDVALLAARHGGRDERWTWGFTLHGPDELYDVSGSRLFDKARAADLVVCISDFARSQLMGQLEREHWDKLKVVRCGVDVGLFRPVARAPRDDGRIEILNVAQAAGRKGQALLVEAVAQLADAGLDARATLVGDGPERAALAELARERRVSERICLPGAVGQDEIRAYYERADVFCLPSFAEGVPVVLMEAMATGLPVVASRVMGIPELVEDGTHGYLVPPGRADAIAISVQQLAGHPGLRERMGREGRRKVAQVYELERSAEELEKLFRAVVPKPKPRLREDQLGADLLGMRIDRVTERQAIDAIMRSLGDRRGGWAITPNLDHVRLFRKRPGLRPFFRMADLVLADGMPLVWASKVRGTPLPERVAGSDLIWSLTGEAASRGHSVFLLGGDPGTGEKAAERLRERFPGLRVAGTLCPPHGFENDPQWKRRIVKTLNAARPDIVYVGLGFPKQEQLISKLRWELPDAWFFGIGISISFVSGDVKRAPEWMQRTGLEWVHRLVQEPRRLVRRYLVDGIPFLVRLLAHSAVARVSAEPVPARVSAVLPPVRVAAPPSVDQSLAPVPEPAPEPTGLV